MANLFQCSDLSYINMIYQCDGIIDCYLNTDDELSCPSCMVFGKQSDKVEKYVNLEYCAKYCHPKNCTCPELYYHCPSGGCLPWSFVCNEFNDCHLGEDEKDLCTNVQITHLSNRNMIKNRYVSSESCDFYCSTGECIPTEKVNDLIPDCKEGDDEELHKSLLTQEQEVKADSCDPACYPAYQDILHVSRGINYVCTRGQYIIK